MLAIVQAHCRFVDTAGSTSFDPATLANLRTTQKNQLVKSLGVLPPSQFKLEEAAESLVVVNGSTFEEPDKLAIVNAINGVATKAGDSTTPRRAKSIASLEQQELHHPQRYLTASDWEQLLNPHLALQSRLDVVCHRAFKLGILSMHEQTSAAFNAVVIVSRGTQCDDNEVYETLQKLKSTFKRLRKHLRSSVTATLSDFPSEPSTFLEMFPDAYGSEEPIACPIDENMIIMLKNSQAKRSTHTSVRSSPLAIALPKRGSSSSTSNSMEIVGPIVQALVQHMPALAGMPHQAEMRPQGLKRALPPQSSFPAQAALTNGEETKTSELGEEHKSADDTQHSEEMPGGDDDPTVGTAMPKHAPKTHSVEEVQAKVSAMLAAKADAAKAAKKAAAAAEAAASKKPAAADNGAVMKRPAGLAPVNIDLGCGKCRGSPMGCVQCRNPAYSGHRWTRT